MFKRPAIRVRERSVYTPVASVDGPGIVCDILRKMKDPIPKYIKPEKREYINPPIQKEKPKDTQRKAPIEPVCVRLVVVGDKIKVRLDTRMYIIQNKYFSKGKKPPLMEYLRALASVGYSERILNKVSNSYAKWESPEYDKKLAKQMEKLWPSTKSKRAQPVVKKMLKAVKKLS